MIRSRRLALIATSLVLTVGGGAAVAWRTTATDVEAAIVAADSTRAPTGVRVRVEVLNATRTPRLARRATRALRDRGFDVVAIGTHPEQLDSTLVLDRTGQADWAARAAAAMQGARVEARPDSSRYLDVTVLVGRSWRPPPETFYP